MAIKVEGAQEIEIEDVTDVSISFHSYEMEIKLETSGGHRVNVELDPKWGSVRDLAREIYDEINAQYGFAEEDAEEEEE